MKILERVETSRFFLYAVLLCTGVLFGTHTLWLLIREEHLFKERNTASTHGMGKGRQFAMDREQRWSICDTGCTITCGMP